ncbi:hypothetical protein COM86_26650, partial [Priestia megaterium]
VALGPAVPLGRRQGCSDGPDVVRGDRVDSEPGCPDRGLDVVDGPDGDAQAQGVRDLDGARGEERDVEVERRRLERLE